MHPQLAQYGQRMHDVGGPGGFPGHDGGHDAGWWIVAILALLLLAVIAGLLAWIGRTLAELRASTSAPALAGDPASTPTAVTQVAAPAPQSPSSGAPAQVRPDQQGP